MTLSINLATVPRLLVLLLLLGITVPFHGVTSFQISVQRQYPTIFPSQHHVHRRLLVQQQPTTCTSACVNRQLDLALFQSKESEEQQYEQQQPLLSSRRSRAMTRVKALARRAKKPLIPIAAALFIAWGSRIAPAEAKFAHEMSQEKVLSIRPGMSKSTAEDALEGRLDVKDLTATASSTDDAAAEKAAPTKKASKSIYGDANDLEEGEDDDFDLDGDDENDFATRKVATRQDKAIAESMTASRTSSEFASYGRNKKGPMLYAKVATGMFVPTFGTMFVREALRQRKEEAYVQKGLEIMKVQKAEYFNGTATTDDKDSDEDDEDDDDDDDEDDDDEDDDDDDDDEEDEPPRRGLPKRPRGGGDDSGSGGGSDTGGDSAPSNEDLSRLKNLFDKS